PIVFRSFFVYTEPHVSNVAAHVTCSHMDTDRSYCSPAPIVGRRRRLSRRHPFLRGRTVPAFATRPPLVAGDEIARARLTERARFAAQLDGELLVACRSEATARRHVGELARELLRDRSYRRLGFVRLRDSARARLG